MTKHTLKILRCSHRKIFKACLAIFQRYEIKGYHFELRIRGNYAGSVSKSLVILQIFVFFATIIILDINITYLATVNISPPEIT